MESEIQELVEEKLRGKWKTPGVWRHEGSLRWTSPEEDKLHLIGLISPFEEEIIIRKMERALEGDPIQEIINGLANKLGLPRDLAIGSDRVSYEQGVLFQKEIRESQERIFSAVDDSARAVLPLYMKQYTGLLRPKLKKRSFPVVGVDPADATIGFAAWEEYAASDANMTMSFFGREYMGKFEVIKHRDEKPTQGLPAEVLQAITHEWDAAPVSSSPVGGRDHRDDGGRPSERPSIDSGAEGAAEVDEGSVRYPGEGSASPDDRDHEPV